MSADIIDLNVKTIFLDIDTTLVDPMPGLPGDSQGELLAKLVMESNGISIEDARKKVKDAESTVENASNSYWPYGILECLNVSENDLWEALSLDAKKRLFMYEDAKAFLGAVKENRPDIKVYTATTNPRLIIFAKLSTGGFADKNGSPCLDGAFGGEEVYPGGKASPEFYTALLDRTGSDVDSSLMVGDSPEMDLKLAKAAGINQVVLPRRNQQEEYVVEADGGMYIKRLDYILELIK